MMKHRYTEEQRNFIRKIAPGKYNYVIAELFNLKFGVNVTEAQIKSFKANHGIKSNVLKKRRTAPEGLFTRDQEAFIADNVKGLSNQKLADLINDKFNLSITSRQMNTWKKNHGLTSELDARFKEGHTPANKGTKGIYNVGGNRTSFKKGQQPLNFKHVGYERTDKDGYLLIKVQNDGPWHKRWRHKHKVLWEEAHGPVPKGHAVIFADGNRENVYIDNFLLVTRAQLARLNQNNLIQSDPELTKTGIIIADIYTKIGERKRKNK